MLASSGKEYILYSLFYSQQAADTIFPIVVCRRGSFALFSRQLLRS
jgi:hypothetical protein